MYRGLKTVTFREVAVIFQKLPESREIHKPGDEAALASNSAVAALTVLDHPDTSRIGEFCLLHQLGTNEGQAMLSRESPRFADVGGEARALDVPYLSRRPIYLKAWSKGIRLVVASSSTAVRVDGFSVKKDCGFTEPTLECGVVIELAEHVVLLLHRHRVQRPKVAPILHQLGHNRWLDPLKLEMMRLARLYSTVLICGEFGTEKMRVAKLIHQLSARNGPFISVNLSELSASRVEAQLFGDSDSGFNDQGSFGRANEGTLYIDEIDQAPLRVQEILVHFLRTGMVPGPNGPRALDLRLIAATAASVDIVKAERNVPSLLHDLGNTLAVPPLRDRRDDVGRLFIAFVREALTIAGEEKRLVFHHMYRDSWLPKGFVSRLALYRWPGNVAQLRNVAEQLVADSRGKSQAVVSRTLEQMF